MTKNGEGQRQLAIVVMAAGQGTRLKSDTPKVLHRIGGRTLLGHVLSSAEALGSAHVRVVVRHKREEVVASLEDYPGVIAVDQDDIPGTGRAVQLGVEALPAEFDGDVLVLSGDVPLIEPDIFRSLLTEHAGRAAAATLLSAELADPHGYGRVIRDASGLVARIVEQKGATAEEAAVTEINAGVYVFRAPELRRALADVGIDNEAREMYLTDVIRILRADGHGIAAVSAPDASAALGVNDRRQLAEAGRMLNQRVIRRWEAGGVTVQDPHTTWIDDTATFEQDVTILPNTHILGASHVSTGATIGPDTSIVDTEVGEGAVVRRSDANLAVIGAGANVGPWAYLRAGAVLGRGAKAGTFVEIKNSTVGDGSKVPHLSYVGDTEIGVGVNLGAGAITANYDDVAKHRTVIGDHVHTGSHTVLIAPVRLGDGAKTGAGAVIRKDVPPGALGLSVAPQRNLQGWVEKNRAGTAAAEAAERARDSEKATDDGQE
ncbi:bifunctional UDP-N-acetylglucosamine pyrophosphorylase/glucosamine-1-phosphate N-acetyltransferase [Microbacterium amylolyticum]|uniref:Bifunctional protein GlmU n=2 Tax=Microbacterium amylolyticum TaxID=936337 RepID=A0ABS4ZL04_9MICO|nr:bifunctional UDP-N-acetylglucosamine pyrophosphorylase/glucosamine-1-phosphate N-acetyltransferase [Microbacterium amylolyticum]